MDPLDLADVTARLDRATDELRRAGTETTRAGEVRWRSGAADRYRDRVRAEADDLAELERATARLRDAVPALERLARHRAETLGELASVVARAAHPRGSLG